MENLPLRSGIANAILAYESFHHIPDRNRALAGYHRVMGTSGRVVLAEPGSAHEKAEVAVDAMEKFGILEKGMDLPDVVGYAAGTGFNQPEQLFVFSISSGAPGLAHRRRVREAAFDLAQQRVPVDQGEPGHPGARPPADVPAVADRPGPAPCALGPAVGFRLTLGVSSSPTFIRKVRCFPLSVTATTTIATLVGSFALSVAVTPLLRRLAHRAGYLVEPRSERWRREAVPVLGGYAIAAGCLAGAAASGVLRPLAPLFIGAMLMFVLGALDDALHFQPASKLVAQTVIGAIVVFLMPRVSITGVLPLDALLSLVWIVGITNAFNLLDNMDGLSAGIAAIAGLSYMAVLSDDATRPLIPALAGLVGASLGFLVYNARPASIFMGDSGSLFLGSFLAGTALLGGARRSRWTSSRCRRSRC